MPLRSPAAASASARREPPAHNRAPFSGGAGDSSLAETLAVGLPARTDASPRARSLKLASQRLVALSARSTVNASRWPVRMAWPSESVMACVRPADKSTRRTNPSTRRNAPCWSNSRTARLRLTSFSAFRAAAWKLMAETSCDLLSFPLSIVAVESDNATGSPAGTNTTDSGTGTAPRCWSCVFPARLKGTRRLIASTVIPEINTAAATIASLSRNEILISCRSINTPLPALATNGEANAV